MAIMRKAFQMFDTTKSGYIEVLKISTILNTMGQLFDDSELQSLIEENDPEGKRARDAKPIFTITSNTLDSTICIKICVNKCKGHRFYDAISRKSDQFGMRSLLRLLSADIPHPRVGSLIHFDLFVNIFIFKLLHIRMYNRNRIIRTYIRISKINKIRWCSQWRLDLLMIDHSNRKSKVFKMIINSNICQNDPILKSVRKNMICHCW